MTLPHIDVAGAGFLSLSVIDQIKDDCTYGFFDYPQPGNKVTRPLGILELQGIDRFREELTMRWFASQITEGKEWVDWKRVTYWRASEPDVPSMAPKWAEPELVDSNDIPGTIRSDCPYGVSFTTPVINPDLYREELLERVLNHRNCRGVKETLITDLQEFRAEHQNTLIALGPGARHVLESSGNEDSAESRLNGADIRLIWGLIVLVECDNFPEGQSLGWKLGDDSFNGFQRPGTPNQVAWGATRFLMEVMKAPTEEDATRMIDEVRSRMPHLRILRILDFLFCPRPIGKNGWQFLQTVGNGHRSQTMWAPGGGGLSISRGYELETRRFFRLYSR